MFKHILTQLNTLMSKPTTAVMTDPMDTITITSGSPDPIAFSQHSRRGKPNPPGSKLAREAREKRLGKRWA